MKSLLLPCVLSATLLAACHSDPKTPATTAMADKPAATAPAIGATNSLGAFYRIYRGLLPGTADSLTLHFVQTPTTGDTEINGTFATYTDAQGQPYHLLKRSSATDSLVLEDISYEHLNTDHEGPKWRLRQQGTALVGTIAGQPVRLKLVQSRESIAFRVRLFSDSIAAFPNTANSPYAHIGLQALVPVQAPAELTASILRDLHGDTLNTQPAIDLEQQWQQWQKQFAKDYREDAQALGGDGTTEAPAYALRYESQQATYVLWNQAPLLSLAYYNFSYSGGAHGSYGTIVASYDTRTGQRLRFADIFRPGAETQLSPVLDRAVRRTLRIAAGEALDQTLFVKKMPVTHNVYLTGGGAVFVYTPYEIASYAQGEIHVFVPMADLKPLLATPKPV